MGQQQFLIDSNAVIDYLGAKLPEKGMAFMASVVNDIPKTSVITRIEVLSVSNVEEQAYKVLQEFMDVCVVLDVEEEVANMTIQLRKKLRMKTPDAIIAATALVYDMTLITRNTKDFSSVTDLKTVNPWE